VEAYIFNGANLMWPGVYDHSGLGEFKKDDVISVRSIKGEIIAIGAMGCSEQEFAKNAEKNGIAVHILHFKQDKLWELGPKTIPEVIVQAKVLIPEKMKE
jgi:predicted ribosome-associated RNA-binding protein Tma20